MGGSVIDVSEASLLDLAQRTALGAISEREATKNLSSDKVARYLQYVTHFKSIGYAMRMIHYAKTALAVSSLIGEAAMYRDTLLNLPPALAVAKWEILAVNEVKALTRHYDRNLSATVGTREFSEVLAYDERLLRSLEEAVGENWTMKFMAGGIIVEEELTTVLRNQLNSYEYLHRQIGAAHRAKWGMILSFMQDIVDSLRI